MPDNLEMLLKRLRLLPVPEAPVPASLGPLDPETARAFAALNPEPVPPAFVAPAPIDTSFVNQYAGAAPAPPAPLSRAQRIFNAIGGFGAGYRGQGAQYLDQLDEPQRRYEAATERYQGRRAQGVELAERRAEREADRANRAAELQYEREFNVWLKKTGVRDAEAKERMRQAFEIQKLREAERIADEKQQRAIEAATEKQRRDIEHELATKDDAPTRIAREISEYRVGKRDTLSPAAEKWRGAQAKLAEAKALRLARIGAAGRGGDGRLMAVLENGQLVPASLVNKEKGYVALGGAPVKVVNYVGGGAAGAPPQPAPQVPTGVEGFGLIPGIETAAPPEATREQLRQYARENKISLKQAQEDFKKAGVTMR